MAMASWFLLLFSRIFSDSLFYLGYWKDFPGPDQNKQRSRELRRKGFLVIKNFADEKLVKDLKAQLIELLPRRGSNEKNVPSNDYANMSYKDLALNAKSLVDVRGKNTSKDQGMIDIFNPFIDQLTEQEIARIFKSHDIYSVIKSSRLPWEQRAKPTCTNFYYYRSVTSPRSLHFDALIPHYKCFLVLQDISTDKQGPYSVIPYSHRLGIYHRLMAFVCKIVDCDFTDAIFYNKRFAHKFYLNAGDLLVGDQRCIHGDYPAYLDGEKSVFVKCYTHFA